jgi:hypothetical protein
LDEYKQGWYDAFSIIADYVEREICPVTGQMIRRMKDEGWRHPVKAASGDAEKAQGEQEAEIAGEQG